ncbi:MAG: alpha/beta hydrolase [Methylococcaceae bacterium]|nr:alpha/beta hydrolase [Methylococcaceae bacterium]
MTDFDAFFKTNDQLGLYYKSTRAEANQATIVFVHGVGEHIGRYTEIFEIFSDQGYNCFGFDQRGFGRSEGERGHINAFSDYVDDLEKFIEDIVCPQSDSVVYLLGHSMGSLVVLSYIGRNARDIQGLLLFSCPVRLASPFANVGGLIAELLSVISTKLSVPNFIDPRALSNNLANIQALIADPYAFNKVTIQWVLEFKRARAQITQHARKVSVPVIMHHGEADTIASLKGAKALFEALGSADKIFISYPGLKHELLNHYPADRAKVLEQTLAWLQQRLR